MLRKRRVLALAAALAILLTGAIALMANVGQDCYAWCARQHRANVALCLYTEHPQSTMACLAAAAQSLRDCLTSDLVACEE